MTSARTAIGRVGRMFRVEILSYGISCLWLAAFFAVPVEAHPILKFAVTRQVDPAEGKPGEPSKETFPLTVTLGKQFLILEGKGISTVYDFQHAREFVLDQKNKSFQEFSLYSDVGFRVLEFFNRVNLGTMMRAANVNVGLSDLAQIEHLFSLTGDKSDTVIDSAMANGNMVYRSKQSVLMTVSRKTKALPPAYQGDYWRFMRYYVGGHPAIYTALETSPGVPVLVVVELHDHDVEKRTLELQSIQSGPDGLYSLDGYERAPPGNEPLLTAALVTADAPAAAALRYAEARKARDDAFSQGNYLGAMLAYDEMYLSTGIGEHEWLRMAHPRLIADPMTRRLNDAASAGSPSVHDAAAQKRSLEDFDAIRALKPDYIDIIDVFEGNVRLALHDKQGRQLLFDALRVNPYLTGAWHDLGDSYYREFHMQEAWICWDVGRKISPSDPMMQQVDQLEQLLRSKNPQFF